jgi:signal transduction histidine kinase
MFKGIQLIWADKFALALALFIIIAAVLCWVLGIVGLDGHPNQRFDQAMLDWTTQLEFALVPAVWLLLRIMDFTAKVLFQMLRYGLALTGPRASPLPSYAGAGLQTGGGSN